MMTTHVNLWAALLAARIAYDPLIKDKTVKTDKYSYRYADMASTLDAVMPALCANGVVVYQAPTILGDGLALISKLVHAETGQEVSDMLPLPSTGTMQQLGSAISYARRYLLMAQLGIAGDDDDGQAASAYATAPAAVRATQRTASPAKAQQSAPDAPTEAEAAILASAAKDKLLRKMHAAGTAIYGEEWDGVRHVMVMEVTAGVAESSKDLSPADLTHINDVLETQQLAVSTQGKEWRAVLDKISAKFEAEDIAWSQEQHKQARAWLAKKPAKAAA